jgi:hypothetical protein
MNTVRFHTGPTGYRPAPHFVPPPRPPMPPVHVRASRTGLTTLVVLASLFLISAGVFVTLFLLAGSDHDAAVARLNDRQNELTGLDDRVVSAEAERQRADRRNSGLKGDNADMSGCVDAMRHYLWDGIADSQRTAAARDVLTKCR